MIRIRTRLESETISIPELRPLVGKQVEITVREEPVPATGSANQGALYGSVLRYDAPLDPVAEADWRAIH